MHISRRQSIVFSTASIAIFFLISISWFLWNDRTTSLPIAKTGPTPEEPQADPEMNAKAGDPESRFALTNFHRAETQNGKTIWEITGESGALDGTSAGLLLTNVQLVLYETEQGKVDVTAKQAKVFLESGKIQRAHLSGDVLVIQEGGMRLETTSATIDQSKNTVHAPDQVRIRQANMRITGRTLDADLQGNTFTIHHNVETVIEPKGKNE